MIATPIFTGYMYLVRYQGEDTIVRAKSACAAIAQATQHLIDREALPCAA
jgi:hypothetical protein